MKGIGKGSGMKQQGSSNRDKIVQAADQLFYLRGYHQTSFSDIAEETGIPRGNFYYYFKTKDDILSAVLDFRMQLIEQLLEVCEQHSNDPREQLLHLVEVLVREDDNIIQYGCPIGTLSAELSKSSLTMQQQVAAIFEKLRAWIEEKLSVMGFKDRADILSMDILARLQGTTVLANVYHDIEFLHRSAAQHKQWLSELLNNH